MAEVQWIKIKVGMFDGESFKKIKRAKLGGESFRDKLTAVWFELMDFAGKCNRGGAFINAHEIPYSQMEDIATMIDREAEELQLCMNWFISEGMVEIIDDVYQLSNWSLYQNEAGLEKLREQKRIAQAKWREKKKLIAASVDDVDSTVESTSYLPSYSYSSSISNSKDKGKGDCKGKTKHKHGTYGWVLLTEDEYDRLVSDLGAAEAKRCINYVDEAAEQTGNKNKWKNWYLTVRKCHRDGWGARNTKNDTGFATSNPFAEMLEEEMRKYGSS